MHDTGIPASVTIAQFALESGWGKHMPMGSNNPFGIKWNGHGEFVECETKEQTPQGLVTVVAKFQKFGSIADAFRYHARLLTAGPYLASFQIWIHTRDLHKYVQRLGPIYATDSSYATKILDLITNNKLSQYDVTPITADLSSINSVFS